MQKYKQHNEVNSLFAFMNRLCRDDMSAVINLETKVQLDFVVFFFVATENKTTE